MQAEFEKAKFMLVLKITKTTVHIIAQLISSGSNDREFTCQLTSLPEKANANHTGFL